MNYYNVHLFFFILCFIGVIFGYNGNYGYSTQYKGYKVFRAYPKTISQVEHIKRLQDSMKTLDFWTEPRTVGQTVDLMVSPSQFTTVVNHFGRHQINFDVIIEDIQNKIDLEMEEADASQRASIPTASSQYGRMTWTRYHRLNDIHEYMDSIALQNPQIAEVFTIGNSVQGRPINLIKFGAPPTSAARRRGRKPAIWIDGGIHAREWISPATATFFIEQLITGYNHNDTRIRNYLQKLDWYILPVANPDGYEYSHTNSRLWRKNRSNALLCSGVDLNRNFGYQWNQGGASNFPCAENYAGRSAFSEPESRALAQFVLGQNGSIKTFVTLHSYGQFWMTPWGYTSRLPEDYPDLYNLANRGARAIRTLYGTQYAVGSSTNLLYQASGGSDDWAKGAAGIKYSYTLELRDKGRYGFFLPSSQIVATGRETWEGIKILADAMLSNDQNRK